MNRILNGDVIRFAKHYHGAPFHALLADPPYHLTSITKRFGKDGAAPAQFGSDGAFQRVSRGFMSQEWDGGDVAFRPETWRAFWDLLYPGAFCMTFGGSRTAHRMAVAIEDAGYIIHPMMSWVYGSGFPKATRIDTQIDKAAGAEREITGTVRRWGNAAGKGRAGQYANEYESSEIGAEKFDDITKPATDLAQTWEGHRYGLQALKPALEPIIVFQKPYEGRPVDDITRTGAGALNIDGGRIGGQVTTNPLVRNAKGFNSSGLVQGEIENGSVHSSGRWPANFIIQHSTDCKQIGTSPDGYTINRFTDGAKPFGDAVGEDYEGEEVGGESVVWECAEGCPARELDRQSGHLKSGLMTPEHNAKNWGWHKGDRERPTLQDTYGDSGGASRFFFNADYVYEKLEQEAAFKYMAKTGNVEREKGLIHHIPCAKCGELHSTHHKNDKGEDEPCRRNAHPTIKTIALIKHLATLLLPPDEYAPRRIFVPFAGTGSEMIGAFQAGWECIVGVEFLRAYIDIAKARLDYWLSLGIQQPLF